MELIAQQDTQAVEEKKQGEAIEEYDLVKEVKPEKYLTAVFETCKSKPIIEYNRYGLGKIRERIPVKTILITCNLTPEYEYREAWLTIIKERRIIVDDLIKKYKEIQFVISTVEHHHTISLKMKGIKKQEMTEDKKGKNIMEETAIEDTNIKEEIKEGSIYSAYTKKTLKEFAEITNKWKEDKKVTRDMTETEKIVTYYNILQTLHYLNGESGRDEEFRSWIQESQKVMTIYMQNKDAKTAWSEWQMGIISKHKEMGNNLLGYPHIHIAVAYAGITNPEKFRKEIYDYLMEKRVFPDPDVAETKTKESENEGRAIIYVLKNYANKYVKDKLTTYGYEGEIIKMHINRTGNEEIYKNYGLGFIEKQDKKYYRPIGMEIYERKQVQMMKLVTIPKKTEIDPEKNNYNKTVAHILDMMRKNQLVICDKEIYKKREGTKMTYEQHESIETFVNNITSLEPYSTISNKWKGEILKIMNQDDEAVEKCAKLDFGEATGNYRVEFPRIKMDYRMIEFKDFYFNTITTEIYKEQTKYYCHYYSAVTIDNLENKMRMFEEKSEWLNILKRNRKKTREILGILFGLLRPRIQKSHVPMPYGDSDGGKSTLITPFRNYYPDSKVSVFLTTLSEYHISDLLEGRELAIMEEGNTILNDKSGRPRLLATLEGAIVVSNKKHGEIKNIEQRANIAIILNPLKGDIYTEDPAVMNRVYPIGNMESIKEKKIVKDNIEKEEPYIYLYTGLEFMRLGKEEENNNDFFVINEIMTKEQEEDIEEIKRYYKQEKRQDREAVDIYSEEYMKAQNVNKMKTNDSNRKIKYDASHTQAVQALQNHPNIIGEEEYNKQQLSITRVEAQREHMLRKAQQESRKI